MKPQKNVDIRRLNLSLEKEVKVLDGVAKHFLSDEDMSNGNYLQGCGVVMTNW